MRLRPPTPADRDRVLALLAARDLADLGEIDSQPEDLDGEWRAPTFDLARDARVVELDDGGLAAFACVRHHGGLVAVAPAHEGRGIGMRLLRWIEERERAVGRALHRQYVARGNPSAAGLLRRAGYAPVRGVLRMHLALASRPVALAPPEGIELRLLDPGRDAAAVHALDDRAFSPAPDYVPESFTAFAAEHLNARDLDREASLVACRDGTVAGFLLARRWARQDVGFVDILAVDPDEHGRGIGGALLTAAFDAFAGAGLVTARLGVASSNAAGRRLYERLGMTPRHRFDVYERRA